MTTQAFDDPSNPELNTAGATPKAETLIGDLYRSELGRAPDAGGLAYWSNAYNTGMSLDDIRNKGFRASEEYQNLQRGTGIPETVLVNPPDVNYPIMDSGYGYSNPPEVAPQTPIQSQPLPSYLQPDDFSEQLSGVYQKSLGRMPDQGGLSSWYDAYKTGTSFDDVIKGIQNSNEGREYAANQVNTLYNKYLGRDADPEGLNFWQDKIRSGMSLSDFMNQGIFPSDEYQQKMSTRPPIIDPRPRSNIPIDSRQLQSPTGEYYYPGDPRFSQIDPVRDFIQNIDQQLPYLQRVFQQQLQLLGDPVAAARAVLGSLK